MGEAKMDYVKSFIKGMRALTTTNLAAFRGRPSCLQVVVSALRAIENLGWIPLMVIRKIWRCSKQPKKPGCKEAVHTVGRIAPLRASMFPRQPMDGVRNGGGILHMPPTCRGGGATAKRFTRQRIVLPYGEE